MDCNNEWPDFFLRKEVGGIASNVQGRATGNENNGATACEGSIEWQRGRMPQQRAKYIKEAGEGVVVGGGGGHLKVSVKVTQPCDSHLKLVHLHGGLEVLQSVRRGE